MARSEPDAVDGSTAETDGGVRLSRTVDRREGGIVVRFAVENEGTAPERAAIEQEPPPEHAIQDAGFRPDAAPEEWAVESGLVRGETRLAGPRPRGVGRRDRGTERRRARGRPPRGDTDEAATDTG